MRTVEGLVAARERICARTVALACVAVALIEVGSAQAVTRHVFYGKPGKVQLPRTQGYHPVSQTPQVVFPTHWIRRSPAAPGKGKRQRICTTLQIWSQTGSPAKWAVKASSPNFCGWISPGNSASVGRWSWPSAAASTPYHAEFVVTWATRTRKLGKASYDFNTENDYECVTRSCFISTDQTTKFPYLSFTP